MGANQDGKPGERAKIRGRKMVLIMGLVVLVLAFCMGLIGFAWLYSIRQKEILRRRLSDMYPEKTRKVKLSSGRLEDLREYDLGFLTGESGQVLTRYVLLPINSDNLVYIGGRSWTVEEINRMPPYPDEALPFFVPEEDFAEHVTH